MVTDLVNPFPLSLNGHKHSQSANPAGHRAVPCSIRLPRGCKPDLVFTQSAHAALNSVLGIHCAWVSIEKKREAFEGFLH